MEPGHSSPGVGAGPNLGSGHGTTATRRRFLADCTRLAGMTGLVGTLLALNARVPQSLPIGMLRPPGALAEDEFADACIRCGLCVRACPFATLRLARPGAGPAIGTPYFVPRLVACEMCPDIPCAGACPTDALSKELDGIQSARMGVAVFAGRDTCFSVTGVAHCRACWLACPLRDRALTMELRQRAPRRLHFEPTVHADLCTGCGKCEHACLTAAASIRVLPPAGDGVDI